MRGRKVKFEGRGAGAKRGGFGEGKGEKGRRRRKGDLEGDWKCLEKKRGRNLRVFTFLLQLFPQTKITKKGSAPVHYLQ